ncbi:hypothetical protein [Bordetella genomosp. 10]|uniref:hypothetical protein n=1 Tax=Bordetella genomosp. 10 TaxID=1416804 RepID=UPI0015C5AC07|nr:hypothetical protein [Bordetella genomosp. 10]
MNLAAQGLARVRQHAALAASERRRRRTPPMDVSVDRMLAVSAGYFFAGASQSKNAAL